MIGEARIVAPAEILHKQLQVLSILIYIFLHPVFDFPGLSVVMKTGFWNVVATPFSCKHSGYFTTHCGAVYNPRRLHDHAVH